MNHYKKILISVDLDKQAERIINAALKVCSSETEIHLVHVILPVSQAFYANGMGLIEPMVDLVDLEDKVIKHGKDHLMTLARELLSSHNCKIKILKGDVVDSIIDYAKQEKSELIVVGSHATSGIKLLLGSTANGVLHHAPCDTLMYRIKA